MKVLILATGQDTGGQGIRIREGFLRHAPDWQVDVLNAIRSPLGYPEQSTPTVRERLALTRKLYAEADVIHLRQTLDGWKREDRGQHKPTILHHHGSLFRSRHGKIGHEARQLGAVQVASTLDLTLLEPDVEWLPAPYDLEDLAALRSREYQPSDRIRIAHFPTASKVKSTDAFMAAVASLGKRYPIDVLTNVERGRVIHRPWSEVMARKAGADILYDQVQLGYGNNAVEAWGMGMPVVAGVVDPAVRDLMLSRFGTLPFVEATEQTIEATLERLILSEAMRSEYAALGLAHVQRFHVDDVVVRQLQALYASAPPTGSLTSVAVHVPRWKRVAA